MSRTTRRFGGSLALGAIAVSAFAPFAFAQQAGDAIGAAPEVTNAQIQQLMASVTSSDFTIHKFDGDPVDPQPELTGTEADAPTGLNGIDGVQFSVTAVEGIDLTTIEGWQTYAGLNQFQTPEEQGLTSGASQTLTTANGGVASGTFDVGVYRVVETVTPDGATPIAPFYVALPLPANTATGSEGWNTDVHVYPKNQPLQAVKAVVDEGVVAGESVQYTVNTDVPAVPQSGAFDGYDVVDDYDETKSTPDLSTLEVSFQGLAAPVILEEADYTVTEGEGAFTVSLTRAGLNKLADNRAGNPDMTVQVQFDAAVNADVAPGEIVNSAFLIPPNTASAATTDTDPRDPWDPNDDPNDGDNPPPVPPVTTNDVETIMGQITVNKTDSETGAALAGAEFQLYKCDQGTTTTQSGPISINGADTWVTDDAGNVVLPAVQVEDYANNEAIEDVFDYCLVESKAPAGYALNPTPTSASVTNGARTVTVDIENVPDDGMFNLPNTGVAGTIGLIALGGLAAAAGANQLRKREDEEVA